MTTFTRKKPGGRVAARDINELQIALENAPTVAEGGGTPGAAGDIRATVGGIITNVKPGRIDARVRGLSTAATSNTTLLATLAAESGTAGAELWIPEGEYKAELVAPTNLTLRGVGTLRSLAVPTQEAVIMTEGCTGNLSIEGITVNGNGLRSGIRLYNGDNPLTYAKVIDVTLENVGGTYPNNCGVRVIRGAAHVDVIGNRFVSCGRPVALEYVGQTRVQYNRIVGMIYNGITAWGESAKAYAGLDISYNTIVNCPRIGIELYPSSGTNAFDAPVLVGNDVTISNTFDTSEGFGYSVTFSPGARVSHNAAQWVGTGTPPAYGYEIISPEATVTGNTARGFNYGLMANSSPSAVFDSNTTYNCYIGITDSGPYTPSRYLTISKNRFVNARDIGIDLTGLSVQFGGHEVVENVISRATSWTGDASRTFNAIKLQSQYFPSRLSRNRIVQGMAVPTAGLVFLGIGVYHAALGNNAKTELERNVFVDLATTPMMDPLFSNTGSTTVTDVTLTSNQLTLATGVTSAVTTW